MIRDAQPGEEPELTELQRRSSDVWDAYREALAEHPEVFGLPAGAVEQRRVRVAVDHRNRPVGFSVVEPVVDGACELDGLFVDADAIRSGVGRALVEDLVRRAREEGAKAVEVTAGPEGRGFYERVGFVAGEATETLFGPALRMRRDI